MHAFKVYVRCRSTSALRGKRKQRYVGSLWFLRLDNARSKWPRREIRSNHGTAICTTRCARPRRRNAWDAYGLRLQAVLESSRYRHSLGYHRVATVYAYRFFRDYFLEILRKDGTLQRMKLPTIRLLLVTTSGTKEVREVNPLSEVPV